MRNKNLNICREKSSGYHEESPASFEGSAFFFQHCRISFVFPVEVKATRKACHTPVVEVFDAPRRFCGFPHEERNFGLLQQPFPLLPRYYGALTKANLQIKYSASNQLASCFLPAENLMCQHQSRGHWSSIEMAAVTYA